MCLIFGARTRKREKIATNLVLFYISHSTLLAVQCASISIANVHIFSVDRCDAITTLDLVFCCAFYGFKSLFADFVAILYAKTYLDVERGRRPKEKRNGTKRNEIE